MMTLAYAGAEGAATTTADVLASGRPPARPGPTVPEGGTLGVPVTALLK
jgi:hypothetical protein